VTPEQVATQYGWKTADPPVGATRLLAQERVVKTPVMKRPGGLWPTIVRVKTVPITVSQVGLALPMARRKWTAWRYQRTHRRTLLLTVQNSSGRKYDCRGGRPERRRDRTVPACQPASAGINDSASAHPRPSTTRRTLIEQRC
jgi:hypothetical protein